jgi:hypothetical protein
VKNVENKGTGVSFEVNEEGADASSGKNQDAVWIGVIVGVLVLVGIGIVVIIKASKPRTDGGFVHYESSLTSSEHEKAQELLANF